MVWSSAGPRGQLQTEARVLKSSLETSGGPAVGVASAAALHSTLPCD